MLAMDIGSGTKDTIFFSPEIDIETCMKFVVPSPSRILAERFLKLNEDLVIAGYTIGGGFLAKVLKKHVQRGLPTNLGHGKGQKPGFSSRGYSPAVQCP